MRKRIIGIIVIGTSLLLAGCGSRGEVKRSADGKQVLSGYITLSGAFALYPLAIQWADEFHRLHPDVDIDISAGGAGKGITDVLADQVDIAMVSRELKPQEKEKGALAYAVAKDAVVATINANNPGISGVAEDGIEPEAGYGDLGRKDEDECLYPKRCLWCCRNLGCVSGQEAGRPEGNGRLWRSGRSRDLAEGCERHRIQQHRLCL